MCPFLPPDSELAPIFQTSVTGAPATRPLSTRQPLAHSCSSSFCTHFFSFSPFSSSTVTFTGVGNVFTERSLKLKPSWLRAQFMHLENRNPSLLNECGHLLSVGCVCAVITMHHHIFSWSTFLHQLQAALQSVRSQFFQVVIRVSLSSSCACLASSPRSAAKRRTCSGDGKRCCLTTSQRISLSNPSPDCRTFSHKHNTFHGTTPRPPT